VQQANTVCRFVALRCDQRSLAV